MFTQVKMGVTGIKLLLNFPASLLNSSEKLCKEYNVYIPVLLHYTNPL